MKDDRDMERELRVWLNDGPTTFSSRAFAEALTEIHATPQERGERRLRSVVRLRIRPRLVLSVAALAAAVVLVAVAIRPSAFLPSVGSPGPQASVPLPLGPLAPGTYTSVQLVPHVRFTVPGGFLLRGERPDDLWLATSYANDAAEFDVIRSDEVGVLDRLAADPRVTASSPIATTVAGIPARSMAISVPAGAYPIAGRNTLVTGAVTIASQADWYINLNPGAQAHVIELTVGTRNVLVFSQAPAATAAAFFDAANSIVASLSFP